MRRHTVDIIVSTLGLLLAAVLVVAGGLLAWAHSFIGTQVHSQLAAQQVYFPPAGSSALASPEIAPYLDRYAGQQLTTGPQAKAYADHFIAVHLSEMTGGKTYAQVSAEVMANPGNAKLAQLQQTVFMGTTLRGMLLNAYAFATMGTIAGYAAIVSFLGAIGFAILSVLGFVHARRVAPDFVSLEAKAPAKVEV